MMLWGAAFVVWYVACCLGAYGIWFADLTARRKRGIVSGSVVTDRDIQDTARFLSLCGPLSLISAAVFTGIKHGWEIDI